MQSLHLESQSPDTCACRLSLGQATHGPSTFPASPPNGGLRSVACAEPRPGWRHPPALSALSASHTLQLKSSYPARRRRPLLEKETEVIPQMMLSWE